MKTIFNKDKREELAKLAKEEGVTLSEMIHRVRNDERKERRVKKQSNLQKLILYRLHHLDADRELVKKHDSTETRFEKVINDKILALNQFKKNNKVDDSAYDEAKKRIESHDAREKTLEARRADRKARIENAKARINEEGAKALAHFLESEKARLKRKEEKRSKYAGKKQKVAPRPVTPEQLQPKAVLKLKTYYFVLERFNADHTEQFDLEAVTVKCHNKTVHKRLSEHHAANAKKYGDEYIGTYVYNEETCSHCILESINPKYYNIDGYLTSRMAAQRAAAAA